MADLRVCSTCNETEDCACQDLSKARRALYLARQDVNAKLGWLVVRLVQQMPDVCSGGCIDKKPANRCPLCIAVAKAKKTIEEVLPS